MTDAGIAVAAAVDQSTVSRWSKRDGFPRKEGGRRDRGEVVAFLDDVRISGRWRVNDDGESVHRRPQVAAPEEPGVTYGDRVRAAWELAPRRRVPAARAGGGSELPEVRTTAVARALANPEGLAKTSRRDPLERPPLLGLVALLLTHGRLVRREWEEAVSVLREGCASERADPGLRVSDPLEHHLLSAWWRKSPATDRLRLIDPVSRELSRVSFVSGSEGTFLDAVLSQLSRENRVPFFGFEYYTPAVVADLMTGIAVFRGARTVYLPACGTGELVWSALARLDDDATITAQSLTTPGGQIVRAGVVLRSASPRVRVEPGTSLTSRPSDVVVTNPPSRLGGASQPSATEPLGLESAYHWLQMVRASMTDTSRAVVVMPRSAATSRATTERQMRKEMLESGLLRAVVNLPDGVFPQARAAMSIWVLARGSCNRTSDDVLVVESAGLTESSRSGVRSLQPIKAAGLAAAVSAWLDGRPWRPPSDVAFTITSARRVASKGAYLDAASITDAPTPLFAVAKAAPSAVLAARKIRGDVEAVVEAHARSLGLDLLGGQEELAVSRLGDVCDVQAAPASQIRARDIIRVPLPNGVTMIEPRMVRTDGRLGQPVAWLPVARALDRRYTTLRDDLVMTRIGSLPRLALVEDQKDWVQGRGVLRVRVREGSGLKPEFLLYYLRQGALKRTWLNLSDATASPSISARAVAQLTLPIPPLERQDHYIAMMRAYRALELAADTLRAAAEDAQDQLLSGLRSVT